MVNPRDPSKLDMKFTQTTIAPVHDRNVNKSEIGLPLQKILKQSQGPASGYYHPLLHTKNVPIDGINTPSSDIVSILEVYYDHLLKDQ
jgi:hypothetical protein